MKDEKRTLNIEELNQISGGTAAQNNELLELIQANPELNRIYKNGLKFHDGNVRHAIEYVFYMKFNLSPDLFDEYDNIYGSSFGQSLTHSDMCDMLRNF